jgi:crotonobetainyl-CoA:carnitine CoA-transferase CaiB-like acyl-CoA transferase
MDAAKTGNPTTPRALEGITVLDLTHLAAGPWCSMMLADSGARVIKIEPPGKGDISRSMGSVFLKGESTIYLSFNRNKESVTLNLQSAQGRELFYQLAKKADVVIENMRPGTVKKLGVDYETISALNPGIVYCSISAFGQEGPYKYRPANDPIVQAMAGLMSITGPADGEPCRVGASIPDYGAAALAAYGIVTALLARGRTGRGQYMDVPLLDATVSCLQPREGEFFAVGQEMKPMGSAHPTFVPYQAFMASDGKRVYLSVFTEKFWHSFCQVVGLQDLETDPRFVTNRQRVANRGRLIPRIEEIFLQKPAEEWIRLMEESGVPCGPVNSMGEALSDPQVLMNGMVVEMEHPTIGKIRNLGSVVKFGGTPVQYRTPPPLLGQHTESVLSELGYSAEEVAKMKSEGVL